MGHIRGTNPDSKHVNYLINIVIITDSINAFLLLQKNRMII